MIMVCLDVEGVLLPEVWIKIAKHFKLNDLGRTTRDEPVYANLMRDRIQCLRDNEIKYSDILKVVKTLKPLDGAVQFLKELHERNLQVSLVSDSFYEFLLPVSSVLGSAPIYCHHLLVENDVIHGWIPRIVDQKPKCVRAFQDLGFLVYAAGDSFNDVGMLNAADGASFINAPETITSEFAHLPRCESYAQLLENIDQFSNEKS